MNEVLAPVQTDHSAHCASPQSSTFSNGTSLASSLATSPYSQAFSSEAGQQVKGHTMPNGLVANGMGHQHCSNGHADSHAASSAADAERQAQANYWQEHSVAPTVEAMMLDSAAATIDTMERPEVLGLLGSVEGQRVVELGAGIGRFTGELARTAGSVLALDFMQASISENQRINGRHRNVSWRCGDATELQLPHGSADVVFSNWLLMYLSDAEVAALAQRMLSWLSVGGCVFFRESCFKQSGDRARKANPTHYRHPADYFRAFDSVRGVTADGQHTHLQLTFCKCIDTYVKVKNNQNQICWKYTKVMSATPAPCIVRRFADNDKLFDAAGYLQVESAIDSDLSQASCNS